MSCLNYGNATATAAQAQHAHRCAERACPAGVDAGAHAGQSFRGILGVATGKSSDHAGEAAVILYVDQSMNVTAPQMVERRAHRSDSHDRAGRGGGPGAASRGGVQRASVR